MAQRVSPSDVTRNLDVINTFIGNINNSIGKEGKGTYWFGYESGRGNIFVKVGAGRMSAFSGTARECYIFSLGLLGGLSTHPKALV